MFRSLRFSFRLGLALLMSQLAWLRAQVAEVELPEVVAPPAPAYNRPDLSVAAWDLSGITLNDAQQEAVVKVLSAIVRDYPDHPAVTAVWKSRLLAIALRLRPEDRNAVVAAGQLARGVLPKPLQESAPPLDRLALSLLKFATTLLDNATDHNSPNYVLGYHLLDAARHFDKSNQAVWESFQKEPPPLRWSALVPRGDVRNAVVDEEIPDLKRTAAKVQSFLMEEPNGSGKPALKVLQGRATRRNTGPRQSLELVLPQNTDKSIEAALPQIRNLLRARHAQWPGGWRVDLTDFGVPTAGQPGVILGIAVLLDSLVAGYEIDDKVYLGCGLNAATGQTVPTLSLGQMLKIAETLPVGTVLVVAETDFVEIQDMLLANPERWGELIRGHICVARNLSECSALLSRARPPSLQRNLDDAETILEQVRKGGPSLRTESILKAITRLQEVYPNDLSMRVLDTIAFKRLPAQFSKMGAMNLLGRLGIPVTRAGSRTYSLGPWKDRLNATPYAKAKAQIDRLRPMLPPEAKAYADAISDLAKLYDVLVVTPPISEPMRQESDRQLRVARARLVKVYQELRSKMPSPQNVTAEEPQPAVPAAPAVNEQEPLSEGGRPF